MDYGDAARHLTSRPAAAVRPRACVPQRRLFCQCGAPELRTSRFCSRCERAARALAAVLWGTTGEGFRTRRPPLPLLRRPQPTRRSSPPPRCSRPSLAGHPLPGLPRLHSSPSGEPALAPQSLARALARAASRRSAPTPTRPRTDLCLFWRLNESPHFHLGKPIEWKGGV